MYIYKTTNILNGKIYIGQHYGKRKNYIGSGKLLKEDIKKYGKKNFSNEILEYCDIKNLDIKEKYWIEKLNSNNPDIGYNITIGGNGVDPKTASEKLKGRKFSESHKKNISINHADVSGDKNPMWRKTHSKETINKIKKNIREWVKNIGYTNEQKERRRKITIGRNNPNYNNTPVLQMDLNGNIIKEWKDLYSLKESGYNSKLISRVCRGFRKTAFGNKWQFKNCKP